MLCKWDYTLWPSVPASSLSSFSRFIIWSRASACPPPLLHMATVARVWVTRCLPSHLSTDCGAVTEYCNNNQPCSLMTLNSICTQLVFTIRILRFSHLFRAKQSTGQHTPRGPSKQTEAWPFGGGVTVSELPGPPSSLSIQTQPPESRSQGPLPGPPSHLPAPGIPWEGMQETAATEYLVPQGGAGLPSRSDDSAPAHQSPAGQEGHRPGGPLPRWPPAGAGFCQTQGP